MIKGFLPPAASFSNVALAGLQQSHLEFATAGKPPDRALLGLDLYLAGDLATEAATVAGAISPLSLAAQAPLGGIPSVRIGGPGMPPDASGAGSSMMSLDGETLRVAKTAYRQLDFWDPQFQDLPTTVKLVLASAFAAKWREDPNLHANELLTPRLIAEVYGWFTELGLSGPPALRFIDLDRTLPHDGLDDLVDKAVWGVAAAMRGGAMSWTFAIDDDLLRHQARLLYLESVRRDVALPEDDPHRGVLNLEEIARMIKDLGLVGTPQAGIRLYGAFDRGGGSSEDAARRILGLLANRFSFMERQLRTRPELRTVDEASFRTLVSELVAESLTPPQRIEEEERPDGSGKPPVIAPDTFFKDGVVTRAGVTRIWRRHKIDPSHVKEVRAYYTAAEEAQLWDRELRAIHAEFQRTGLSPEILWRCADMHLLRARIELDYLEVPPEHPLFLWSVVRSIDPSHARPSFGGKDLPKQALGALQGVDAKGFAALARTRPELFAM